MVSDMSDGDIQALRDLLEGIERKGPAGSVSVVVMAGGDDRFALSPEDECGTMHLVATLPDCLARYDYTSTDVALDIKELDFWPLKIAVIAE